MFKVPIEEITKGSSLRQKGKILELSVSALTAMSRVSRCIDNGPMESFWRMIKSETYYLNKFSSYKDLEVAVIEYIEYYNNRHYQKRLNGMTSLEYRKYLQILVA